MQILTGVPGTYGNHVNKNRLFCLQYPLHVFTSEVVSLLPFPALRVRILFYSYFPFAIIVMVKNKKE